MQSNFSHLFAPKTIAVVGVSTDPSKLGSVIFHNIIKSRYMGQLYPVNPKYKAYFDRRCYSRVSSIGEDIDHVVIAVPQKFVFDVVKDCKKANTKFITIITAGFKETGEVGLEEELKIAEYAKKHSIRIVGPNCLGIISTEGNLNASFASHYPEPGNISMVSQSGAFNTAILDISLNKSLGYRHFLSIGNKSDINENDLLENWYKDNSVKVVAAYIEEFTDGERFIELASSNRHKPTIVLNSGMTESGHKAALSHTGSMSGSAEVIETALKHAGVIHADSIENMFSNLMLFSWGNIPQNDNIAVVTNAGGPGIILADQIDLAGLNLHDLNKETKSKLKKALRSAASAQNPIDVLGDASAQEYGSVLEILNDDEEVGIIVLLLTPQLVTQVEDTARLIINFSRKTDKLIVPLFIGEKTVNPALKLLWENHIPAFQYDEEAVVALSNMIHYKKFTLPGKKIKPLRKLDGRNRKEFDIELGMDKEALSADLTHNIAKECGLDLPAERVCRTYDEVLSFVNENSFPVVMKATTEDAAHKTEHKMIYLSIYTEADLWQSYLRLTDSLRKATGKISVSVLVQEMLKPNTELILGVSKDPKFGHVLLFGHGGVYTNLYSDVSRRLISLGTDEMHRMIAETKISKILEGYRGAEPVQLDKVLRSMQSLQKIVQRYPEIESIDINPLMVTVNRAIAVDVKIFV